MSNKAVELKKDIEELHSLMDKTTRQRSKDVLSLEIRKIQTELVALQKQVNNEVDNATKVVSNNTPKCFEIKLKNYAWGQTDDNVKIYIDLNNVHTLPTEAITCDFTEKSMDLHIMGLENKNYGLTINNLCEAIVPQNSSYKVKTNKVLIILSKKNSKNWPCITSVEKQLKQSKEASMASMKNSDDPSAGIMDMMKKMYNEGDDVLKQTIAKAWTESQEKRGNGLNFDM